MHAHFALEPRTRMQSPARSDPGASFYLIIIRHRIWVIRWSLGLCRLSMLLIVHVASSVSSARGHMQQAPRGCTASYSPPACVYGTHVLVTSRAELMAGAVKAL